MQRLQIYACIIHPEFNYEVEQNDIAVIRVSFIFNIVEDIRLQ